MRRVGRDGRTPENTMNPQPSAEAVALAVKLSDHPLCPMYLKCGQTPCHVCIGIAATIDRELQLPQKNAALLLAQTLVYAFGHEPNDIDAQIVDHIRDALAAIKTK